MATQDIFEKLKKLQTILVKKYELEQKKEEAPKQLSSQEELLARMKKEYIEKNNEYEEVKSVVAQLKFDLDEAVKSREKGEKGMDDSIGAGEMLVNIDIGKETVVNEFLYPEDSDEDCGDCVMECAELRYDPQQELSFDEYFDMCRDLYDEDPREASDKRFMYKGTVYYPIA